MNNGQNTGGVSRRDFLKTSAVVSTVGMTGFGGAFAAGSDKIRLGVVGCGGRGRHDSTKCLQAVDNIELVAMGDMFSDRLEATRKGLKASLGDKVNVTVKFATDKTSDITIRVGTFGDEALSRKILSKIESNL